MAKNVGRYLFSHPNIDKVTIYGPGLHHSLGPSVFRLLAMSAITRTWPPAQDDIDAKRTSALVNVWVLPRSSLQRCVFLLRSVRIAFWI